MSLASTCHPNVNDVFSLIHPLVQVKARAAVKTVCLSQRVRFVTRRQIVKERVCAPASPRSAPSQAPRKTSPSAARARASAWMGWGGRHITLWLNTVQLYCQTRRQRMQQCCKAGLKDMLSFRVHSWPQDQKMTKECHCNVRPGVSLPCKDTSRQTSIICLQLKVSVGLISALWVEVSIFFIYYSSLCFKNHLAQLFEKHPGCLLLFRMMYLCSRSYSVYLVYFYLLVNMKVKNPLDAVRWFTNQSNLISIFKWLQCTTS